MFSKNTYFNLGLLFLYLLPIMLANVYYTDDMARVLHGGGWDHDSRFVATWLMKLLSLNMNYVISIFPFSLLIAGLIFYFSGWIVATLLELEIYSSWKLTPLVLVTSPFLLENLAYRYDAISMAASVFLSIVPFIFFKLSKRRFLLSSIICLYLAFGLFQTSVMIYFSMTLCLFIKYAIKMKYRKLWHLGVSTLFSFIVSFSLYKNTTQLLNLKLASRGDFILFESASLYLIQERLLSYFSIFKMLFQINYLVIFVFILILSIFGFLWYISVYIKPILLKFLSGCIILLALSGLLLLVTLPNLIIQEPWYTARTFIAYPFVIYGLLLLHPVQLKYITSCSTVFVSIIIYYSFVLSSVYGTILKNNNDYAEFISGQITHTIINQKQTDIEVMINGQMPIALKSALLYREYPIAKLLAPNYGIEGWSFGVFNLSRHYFFKRVGDPDNLKQIKCNLIEIESNNIYSIFQQDNKFIIDFTEQKCDD